MPILAQSWILAASDMPILLFFLFFFPPHTRAIPFSTSSLSLSPKSVCHRGIGKGRERYLFVYNRVCESVSLWVCESESYSTRTIQVIKCWLCTTQVTILFHLTASTECNSVNVGMAIIVNQERSWWSQSIDILIMSSIGRRDVITADFLEDSGANRHICNTRKPWCSWSNLSTCTCVFFSLKMMRRIGLFWTRINTIRKFWRSLCLSSFLQYVYPNQPSVTGVWW